MDENRQKIFHDAGEELAESLEFLHTRISKDESGLPLCVESIEMEILISAFMKRAYEGKILGTMPGLAVAVLAEIYEGSVNLAQMGNAIPEQIDYATTSSLQ